MRRGPRNKNLEDAVRILTLEPLPLVVEMDLLDACIGYGGMTSPYARWL